MKNLSDLKKTYLEHEKKALEDYFTFLRFESISTDPAYKKQVLSCADWLADYLRKMHFDVEMWPTTGYPTIFASFLKAGPEKPTLLIYHHYDVQPVDPINEWTTPPFQPTVRNGEVYARGAQDNKGQCFYTIQALKMLLDRDKELPINIKLCIEGEEECGSNGLSGILAQKRKELKADYLAIVDVGIQDKNSPSVTLGVRGLITMDLDVQGSRTDLHSGSHGGLAYNPIRALASILASMHDRSGGINIPGFYDDVKEISKEEKAHLSLEVDEKKYKEMFGMAPTGGESQLSPSERVSLRPTVEFNGVSGGYSGPGFKTVIPSHAHAKVSCRLVPDQDPQKIGRLVAKFLESQAPSGITVKVKVHSGCGKAARANPTSAIVQAFSKSFSEVFGKPCKFILDGASIPIVTALTEVSESEMVLVGLGLPDDQIHAPDEHFGIDRFGKGVLIMARTLEILGNH